MSDKKVINLGNIVEDVVTGLTGTVLQILEHMNGTRQIAFQPKGDGKTIPGAMFIDDYLINVTDVGVADRVPTIDKTDFVMGQEVREITESLGKMTDTGTEGQGRMAKLTKEYGDFVAKLGEGHPEVKRFAAVLAYANEHLGYTPDLGLS